MYSYKELLEKVNNEIVSLNLKKDPAELYEPIEYILSGGGKRLRPVLTLISYSLFNDKISNAIQPALGIEVFHNFTLLHDDIMDNADVRRNRPTVHKKWDENTAILSGDAMMIKAYEFFIKSNIKNKEAVLDFFNETALKVCEGQQLDMNFETINSVSEKDYILMIRLKTAELLAGALKIGAMISDSDQSNYERLYDLGINMGLAFQLQDDFLDVYGDPEVFGKKIGGDIIANKKTYLLIKALELAKDETHDELTKLITEKSFVPSQKIRRVTSIYDQLNIKEISKEKILKYSHDALENLKGIEAEESRKKPLKELVEHLINRTS